MKVLFFRDTLRVKVQAIESEKIPAIHTSEKVLKSRIYKELLQISKEKKANVLTRTVDKRLMYFTRMYSNKNKQVKMDSFNYLQGNPN